MVTREEPVAEIIKELADKAAAALESRGKGLPPGLHPTSAFDPLRSLWRCARIAVMSASGSSPADLPRKEWRHFAAVFDKLGAPLRPSAGDVAHVRRAIAGRDGKVLLLGVTPELSVLGRELIAVDISPRMIAGVWPGDGDHRRAILGDWTKLPFDNSTFDAVIGDGSLNSAPEALDPLLREIRRVLSPAGTAVFRVFCSPEEPETLLSIQQDIDAGWPGNLHALKWRIAMVIAASMPDAIVPVRTILATFNQMYPDRARLAAATGWSLDEISTVDAYDGADHSLGFPTLPRMLELAAPWFRDALVLPGAGYPLAERCPTIAWSADRNPARPSDARR